MSTQIDPSCLLDRSMRDARLGGGRCVSIGEQGARVERARFSHELHGHPTRADRGLRHFSWETKDTRAADGLEERARRKRMAEGDLSIRTDRERAR